MRTYLIILFFLSLGVTSTFSQMIVEKGDHTGVVSGAYTFGNPNGYGAEVAYTNGKLIVGVSYGGTSTESGKDRFTNKAIGMGMSLLLARNNGLGLGVTGSLSHSYDLKINGEDEDRTKTTGFTYLLGPKFEVAIQGDLLRFVPTFSFGYVRSKVTVKNGPGPDVEASGSGFVNTGINFIIGKDSVKVLTGAFMSVIQAEVRGGLSLGLLF